MLYLGLLSYINIFGVTQLGPLAYHIFFFKWMDFTFYLFWHQKGPTGFSVLTLSMICNTLLIFYLWACLRAPGNSTQRRRLFFAAAAITTMTLQLLYWKVGMTDPPPYQMLRFPDLVVAP